MSCLLVTVSWNVQAARGYFSIDPKEVVGWLDVYYSRLPLAFLSNGRSHVRTALLTLFGSAPQRSLRHCFAFFKKRSLMRTYCMQISSGVLSQQQSADGRFIAPLSDRKSVNNNGGKTEERRPLVVSFLVCVEWGKICVKDNTEIWFIALPCTVHWNPRGGVTRIWFVVCCCVHERITTKFCSASEIPHFTTIEN